MNNNSKSQVGQDLWALEMLNNKRDGFFIDIGANDGILFSNSYLLEKDYGWRGLLIEPDPQFFDQLSQRNNIIIKKAVGNYCGICKFAGAVADHGFEVEIITLTELFKQYEVPNVIDYMSLDIEGGEYNTLLGFPFDEYKILTLTVEHNIYQKRPELFRNKEDIYNLLIKNNYIRIKENVADNGNMFEDWYLHNDIINKNL